MVGTQMTTPRSQVDKSIFSDGNLNAVSPFVTSAIGMKRKRCAKSEHIESCPQSADARIATPQCGRPGLAVSPQSLLPLKLSTRTPEKVALPKEVVDEKKVRKIEKHVLPETAKEAADESGKMDQEIMMLKNDEASFLGTFKTIVISLDRRPDRLDGCSARLAAFCPGLRWEKMSAVDGRQTVIGTNMVAMSWDTTENVVYQRIRSERKGWDDLHTYHERVLDLSPGERGCAASHVKAWRQCSSSDDPLLVLEDDAAPIPGFASILKRALGALPNDAHVLYLGYSQAADWRREVSAELVEAEYVWTTVGYIVWPAGARLLLSHLPIDQPVDNYMAFLCASGKLKAYCVRPKLIRQSDAWNCGSDIRHSDENYWGPDSDIVHSETAAVPARNPLAKTIPGAILEDGSSFWDLSSVPMEANLLQ